MIFSLIYIFDIFLAEELISTYSSLSGSCLASGNQLPIYLKITNFTLYINGNFTVTDTVFNALEDIQNINPSSSQLTDCITDRKSCCLQGQTASTLYPTTLVCQISGNYSIASSGSLFIFNQPATPVSMALNFYNVKFTNFLSPQLTSLIQTGSQLSKLVLNKTIIDNIYFGFGLILYPGLLSSPSSLLAVNSSSIIIQNTIFTNYNSWTLQMPSSTRKEGYFLYSSVTFAGSLEIINSSFINITSSLRSTCYAQSTAYYSLPLNNLLNSDQRSRSDLWKQYHYNYPNTTYDSSLIRLTAISGGVSITGSTFKNIIGTSGSVLRIDDVKTANNWFTIYNSVFDNNFAYDWSANIMISKSTGASFSTMLDCPSIEIVNSSFTNTYGCPGTYGNLLFLCYWDTQPGARDSTISSYSLGANSAALKSAWTAQNNDSLSKIRVKASSFSNNLLAVSNSIAVIGTSFTLLQGNKFYDNGGTTAEIAQLSLTGSYLLKRHPSAISFPLPLTHFGQSSVIYINHAVRIMSANNTFLRNWGSWEGSMSLASVITVKNWLKLTSNSLRLYGDTFNGHAGIPIAKSSLITNTNLVKNVYMEPLVSVSVDTDGSSKVAALAPDLSVPSVVNVIFNGVTFKNNTISFAYSNYTYNSGELSSLITNVIAKDTHFQTGKVKLLYVSEAMDDLSYGFFKDSGTIASSSFAFINTLILNNTISTMGCMFDWVSYLNQVTVTYNRIYPSNEVPDTQSTGGNVLPYDRISNANQGIFCVGTTDSSSQPSRIQLNINGFYAQGNLGIIINLFNYNGGATYITNSIFINNTCLSLSMITVRRTPSIYFFNSLFIKNYNDLGQIMVQGSSAAIGLFNTFLYNTGQLAGTMYLDVVYTYYEGLTTAIGNNILPPIPLSSDGTIPQAGLIFNSYGIMNYFNCFFQANKAFSGIFVGFGQFNIYNCRIVDHYITGVSLIGTVYAEGTLTLVNSQITNNTLVKDPSINNEPAFLLMVAAYLSISNVTISEGRASGGTKLIFATSVAADVQGLTIKNVYSDDVGQSSLIDISVSDMAFKNLVCSNTTGLFRIASSTVTISSATIDSITDLYQSLFIFDLSAATITINYLSYNGNSNYDSQLSLIGGDKNSITLTNSYFLDASGGSSKVFSLQSSNSILIDKTVFKYTQDFSGVTLFSFTSGITIVIQNSVFHLPGIIAIASDLTTGFYFISNSIITNSHTQSLS